MRAPHEDGRCEQTRRRVRRSVHEGSAGSSALARSCVVRASAVTMLDHARASEDGAREVPADELGWGAEHARRAPRRRRSRCDGDRDSRERVSRAMRVFDPVGGQSQVRVEESAYVKGGLLHRHGAAHERDNFPRMRLRAAPRSSKATRLRSSPASGLLRWVTLRMSDAGKVRLPVSATIALHRAMGARKQTNPKIGALVFSGSTSTVPVGSPDAGVACRPTGSCLAGTSGSTILPVNACRSPRQRISQAIPDIHSEADCHRGIVASSARTGSWGQRHSIHGDVDGPGRYGSRATPHPLPQPIYLAARAATDGARWAATPG